MKKEKSFSLGDLVAFASALVIAVSFFLPWFATAEVKSGTVVVSTYNVFSYLDKEAPTNVRYLPFYDSVNGTHYLLLVLPLALAVGVIAGIKGWANPELRQVTSVTAFVAGLLGLIYYALVFYSESLSYTIPTTTGVLELGVVGGFFSTFFSCIGLVVQLFLPRSATDPLPLDKAIVELGLAIIVPVLTFILLYGGFIFLRSGDVPFVADITIEQIIIAIVAIIWGVGGLSLLFFVGNWFVEGLGQRWMQFLQPFIFVGPALGLLAWYLAAPTLRTLLASFYDRNGLQYVGFDNYLRVFTDDINVRAWGNNLLWMFVGTSLVVVFATLIAILADRSRFESAAKSLIFMPMAISMVGAGVIWKFIYDFRSGNQEQIGMLNAIMTSFGNEPQGWLTNVVPWNNLFLVIVMVWLQTGYAMVLISAAIKGIPEELLEAARVDGANEFQIFFRMIIPMIAGTLMTVITTVVIFTLKIFDIVRVMTGGNFGTDVIGVRFYNVTFSEGDKGTGAAIAMVLLLAVIPIMIYNLYEFNKRETF